MTQNTNQNLIKFYSISQNSYNKINYYIQPQLQQLKKLLTKQNIQLTSLHQSFDLSQTLLNSKQQFPIDLIKIISIFLYIQQTNQTFHKPTFINYCQQLNLQKNIK